MSPLSKIGKAFSVSEASAHKGSKAHNRKHRRARVAQRAPTPAPARQADKFVDSIGVNTHFRYSRTPYATKYPLIKQKLGEAGIRHARDWGINDNNSSTISGTVDNPGPTNDDKLYTKYRDLYASIGLKFQLLVSPNWGNLDYPITQSDVTDIKAKAGESVEAFEGANEFDHEWTANSLHGAPDWQTQDNRYQVSLHEAVKGNSSTTDLPVVSPSLGTYDNTSLLDVKGDLNPYADYGNMHSYPEGKYPTYWLDNGHTPNARKITPAPKPIIATETGYSTSYNDDDINAGVDEDAQAKYVPRLLLDYFNHKDSQGNYDIKRTYLYELVDSQDPADDPNYKDVEYRFGLLRYDGTEKPAFTALKNLITLLKDPGPDFSPGTLNVSMNNAGSTTLDPSIRKMVLQKRDGTFYLIAWQDKSVYNTGTNEDISNAPINVDFTFGQPYSTIKTYDSNVSLTPTDTKTSGTSHTFPVTDQPLVIEIAGIASS